VDHLQFPYCSRKDKLLHLLFFFSLCIMIACAVVTVLCFKRDRLHQVSGHSRAELSDSELSTLICGVLFFLSFFTAMYVQVKARNTLYRLIVKFIYLNQQWYIDEYEKKDSSLPVEV
jgi:E3 ubiquitin-protein ligase MARCH1/8